MHPDTYMGKYVLDIFPDMRSAKTPSEVRLREVQRPNLLERVGLDFFVLRRLRDASWTPPVSDEVLRRVLQQVSFQTVS